MKLVSLTQCDDGNVIGIVALAQQRTEDVVFSVVGENQFAVVHAEPFVFGNGYSATAGEIHNICEAVIAFRRASQEQTEQPDNLA